MKYDTIDFSFLQTLSSAFGPSGCEDAVAEIIRSRLENTGAEIYKDKMHNLIVRLPAETENAEKLMLCTHMDECGFMIRNIDSDGKLWFSLLGSVPATVLSGRNVKIGNAEKQIKGIIASKPIHTQSADERRKPFPVDKMYVETGALNKDELTDIVDIGDFGTFDSDYFKFGMDKISGKALDSRVGCAILCKICEVFAPKKRKKDIYFVFSVKHEIGMAGAAVAANAIRPETVIAVDAATAYDFAGTPDGKENVTLGQGAVLSYIDGRTIFNRPLTDLIIKLAHNKATAYQIRQAASDYTDAVKAQLLSGGRACASVSFPCRYAHSAQCVVCAEDIGAVTEVLTEALNNLCI